MKYMVLSIELVLVLMLQVALGQASETYDNYIVFNRGLPLEEVINEVQVSTGSSIWMVDPADAQGTLTRVTPEEEASGLMPSWGPGKDKIVFASNRLNEGATPQLDIWTIRPDGTDLQRLTQSDGANCRDGARLGRFL